MNTAPGPYVSIPFEIQPWYSYFDLLRHAVNIRKKHFKQVYRYQTVYKIKAGKWTKSMTLLFVNFLFLAPETVLLTAIKIIHLLLFLYTIVFTQHLLFYSRNKADWLDKALDNFKEQFLIQISSNIWTQSDKRHSLPEQNLCYKFLQPWSDDSMSKDSDGIYLKINLIPCWKIVLKCKCSSKTL